MRRVAANGWDIDADVAQQAADLVLEDDPMFGTTRHSARASLTAPAWEQLVYEMCQGLGVAPRCMPDVNSSASNTCFYGDMNARWYLARVMPSVTNNARSLNMSFWLETTQMSRNIFNIHNTFADWVEESSWPLLPIDLLASAGTCCSWGSFRRRTVCKGYRRGQLRWDLLSNSDMVNPGEVPKMPRWKAPPPQWHLVLAAAKMPSTLPPTLRPRHAFSGVTAWEMGVHKTLSAEVLTALHRALRSLGRSLEVRNLFLEQYPVYMQRCPLYTRMQCSEKRDAITEVVSNAVIQNVPYLGVDGSSLEFDYKSDWTMEELEAFGDKLATVVQAVGEHADFVVITQPVCFMLPFLTSPYLQKLPLLLYSASSVEYMLKRSDRLPFRRLAEEARTGPSTLFVSMFAWNAVRFFGSPLPVVGGLSLYMGIRPQEQPSMGLFVLRKDTPEDCLMPCLMQRVAKDVGYEGTITFVGDFRVTYREMAKFEAVALFPYVSFSLTLEELNNLGIPLFVPKHHAKHVYDPPLYTDSKRAFIEFFARLPLFETFTRPFVVHFDSLADLFEQLLPSRRPRLAALRATLQARAAGLRRQRLALWKSAFS